MYVDLRQILQYFLYFANLLDSVLLHLKHFFFEIPVQVGLVCYILSQRLRLYNQAEWQHTGGGNRDVRRLSP